MTITRAEFDALKNEVANLQASVAALWDQTSRARLNNMVFGPGDNDYGRDPCWWNAQILSDVFKCPPATAEKSDGGLLAE